MTDTPATTTEHEAPESASGAAASLVGTLLSGRYRIEKVLGEGGMGSVFLAEHTLMHKRMAVKVLHPEMTRLPEVVSRFEREAMAAAHIEHPNVAAATDFGKLDNGSFFLVLEYVQGRALRELVAEGAVVPSRAVHIALQIASALARAHQLGIVHRDMKPENVMLVERDGDPDFVKVLDFGIAKVPVAEIIKDAPDKSRKALTQAGIVYGTPEYMAPEQALGRDVDARADLYALGTILYEMLAGARPFDAESPVTLLGMQVTQAPPPLCDRVAVSQLPAALEALVMKLLEKEASRRPNDAREVVEALEQLRRDMQSGAHPRAAASSPDLQAVAPSSLAVVSAKTAIDLSRRVTVLGTRAWEHVRPVAERGWHLLARLQPADEQLRRRLPGLHSRLSLLHGKLPQRVRPAPIVAWLGGAGVMVLLALGLGVSALCSSSTLRVAVSSMGMPASSIPVAPEPAPSRASEEQIKEATAKGPEAVEALMEQFPADTGLMKVLGRSYMAANQPDKAVQAYQQMLAVEPAAADDVEVGQNVVLACQNEVSAEAAYEVLETRMGTRGLDLLYWLAFDSKATGKYQLRAAKVLAKKEVRERGSPALRIALELRTAGTCEGKYKLLDRARTEGDRRALVLLQPLFHDRGCGFLSMGDCWKCMRRGPLLATTVKEIEARVGADAGAPVAPKPSSSVP